MNGWGVSTWYTGSFEVRRTQSDFKISNSNLRTQNANITFVFMSILLSVNELLNVKHDV